VYYTPKEIETLKDLEDGEVIASELEPASYGLSWKWLIVMIIHIIKILMIPKCMDLCSQTTIFSVYLTALCSIDT
jgi:hypothetical protein